MLPMDKLAPTKRAMTDPRGIQSVEVGLGILLPFIGASEPFKLSELAEQAGVSPTQAHAYLVSFRRLGLVERDEETGRYRLGRYALDLAVARMQSFDPLRAATSHLENLRNATNLTIALSVWGSYGPSIVVMRDGMEQVNINSRVGTVYSASGTATGMAFIAHMSEDAVKAAIKLELREQGEKRRVGKTRNWVEISNELSVIRTRKFATISPNPVAGINAIASPIFDYSGDVKMVMTLIGTAANPELNPQSTSVRLLLECASRVSFELGYVEPALAKK
jgi:DNA-binding IclR family transcriptional regulator